MYARDDTVTKSVSGKRSAKHEGTPSPSLAASLVSATRKGKIDLLLSKDVVSAHEQDSRVQLRDICLLHAIIRSGYHTTYNVACGSHKESATDEGLRRALDCAEYDMRGARLCSVR